MVWPTLGSRMAKVNSIIIRPNAKLPYDVTCMYTVFIFCNFYRTVLATV